MKVKIRVATQFRPEKWVNPRKAPIGMPTIAPINTAETETRKDSRMISINSIDRSISLSLPNLDGNDPV